MIASLNTIHSRLLWVGAIASITIVAVIGYALFQKGGTQRIIQREDQVARNLGKITAPMTSSIRNFNPVFAGRSSRVERTAPVFVNRDRAENETIVRAPVESLTIFAAEPQKRKPAQRGPKGDFAPAFRLVKCQLVNTVDSSNIATPIIGLVMEDLWWNGKVIVRANSEVHGVASIDQVRERIASKGEFTFVLKEPDGIGRELVVRGMALDMEKDDHFDTYGITDGSAGLRGDVIRTRNMDVIQLYAASLIGGIAGAFSSNGTGILGNRVYTNNNSLGATALQNGVINPAVGGVQNVLDRYAEQIASAIERDGFFIRVPAGKQFYVYCTETIDLANARTGADDERLSMEDQDLQREKQRDEVRRALPVDPTDLVNTLVPALMSGGRSTK